MLLAIDWSHIKKLTSFDGKKIRCEERVALLKRLRRYGGESCDGIVGESNIDVKSSRCLQPTVILEQGCPLSLIYDILKTDTKVKLISNLVTQDYRVKHSVGKTDENDAKIIYHLSQNGAALMPIDLNDSHIQMHSLYHQYCHYQKARVAMMNMRKAHLRQYGDADMLPYDTTVDTLKVKEDDLLKQLTHLVSRGESIHIVQSKEVFQPPDIKGLGKRLWVGILITANPQNFKCLSAYLRYCGLVNLESLNYKYNRHAKMLYHLLAEEIVRFRDPNFRPFYDKVKVDMRIKYDGESKYRINNAALNRTSTFLAKAIYHHFSDRGESN